MTLEASRLLVVFTPDQLHALIQLVDNASVQGRYAALVVSIQQALADARLDELPRQENERIGGPLETLLTEPRKYG